mgnify:FL=1
MPIEKITNQNFLDKIKSAISDSGALLIAVSRSFRESEKENFNDPDDGFVYSIGHREKGLPDIVILCGAISESSIPKDELEARVKYATTAINHLIKDWDKFPVLPGHTVGSDDDVIIRFSEYTINDDRNRDIKEFVTIQASNYYGTYDYDLLVGCFKKNLL